MKTLRVAHQTSRNSIVYQLPAAAFVVGLAGSACGFPLGAQSAPDATNQDSAPPGDAPSTDTRLPPDARMVDAPSDAPPPPPPSPDIFHLPIGGDRVGSADIVFDVATVIDTTNLGVTGLATSLPLEHHVMVDGAPVAVLYVKRLEVATGRTLRVIGDRPLIIVAETEVSILGTIDTSARADAPGADGESPLSQDAASGYDGVGNENHDAASGGAGGGYATEGGNGGAGQNIADPVSATAGGQIRGDATLTKLAGGGAGGGTSELSRCNRQAHWGGAGGGAIAIYAGQRIQVGPAGGILANGGGGAGGARCGGVFSSGAGGGAGGAIFLQTAQLSVAGVIAANGGGGGSGMKWSIAVVTGQRGEDGGLGLQPARGGATVGSGSGSGGNGGAGVDLPTNGSGNTLGGGGGGAAGRVVFAPAHDALTVQRADTAQISPVPVTREPVTPPSQ